jgi:hypothetical protein
MLEPVRSFFDRSNLARSKIKSIVWINDALTEWGLSGSVTGKGDSKEKAIDIDYLS